MCNIPGWCLGLEETCVDLSHPSFSEECLWLVGLALLYQTCLLALYTAPVELDRGKTHLEQGALLLWFYYFG
jgi:hypothetical protein